MKGGEKRAPWAIPTGVSALFPPNSPCSPGPKAEHPPGSATWGWGGPGDDQLLVKAGVGAC